MSEAVKGNWYVLAFGLQVEGSPMQVASGISIRSLSSPLTVFDLAAAGAAGFRAWATLEPLASGCNCEIESALDADTTPGYDALNRVWLASAVLKLLGFAGHLCLASSSYTWDEIAGHQQRTSHVFREQLQDEGIEAAVFRSTRDLPPFAGGVLDYHRSVLLEPFKRDEPISLADASWVKSNFDTFNRLCSESERFRLALESSVDWRYSSDPRIAIARLWSGIEAIFGVSSELVFRVSLMSASLLAPRGPHRKSKFDEVRHLYDRRSKAVHGERLSSDDLHATTFESYRLLRDLILLTVSRGHELKQADFDNAIFG